jgi:hypothetical protein
MTHRIPSIVGVLLVGLLGSSCGPLGTPLTPVGHAPRACGTNADCHTQELCLKEQGNCEGTGRCQERPTLTSDELHIIVCGCDGHTYGSALLAAGYGVNVAHVGECEAKRTYL